MVLFSPNPILTVFVFISLDMLQSVDELTAEASLSSHVLRSALHSETKLSRVSRHFSTLLPFNIYFALKLKFLFILS